MTSETETSHADDVAIVGAGPIGLFLAGELAAAGVRPVVFEGTTAPSTIPKANGIVGRSAREIARRGILAGTGLRVLSPPRFQFGPLVLDLGIGPRNPLHILPIPQRRLEELLERRAVTHGARIRRGHEVLGFTQDASGVEMEIRSDGDTARVRARFLVGCDGAHSVVRKRAGIGFPGTTGEDIARIARVTIPEGRITRAGDGFDIPGIGHVAAMRHNLFPGGRFSVAPVATLDASAPADLYLISVQEPRGDTTASDSVSVDELRTSLRRVLGAELPFTTATAVRSTVGNSRLAEAYRRGRVLLAGDAAHVFNAGGSALNVGIQDALDLAGRLGDVVRGDAPLDGLDAYEATRRPAAERVLAHTRAQAALGRDDAAGRALREALGGPLTTRGAARALARLLEAG